MEISDKIALVTGGAKGLGLAIASSLQELGAKVQVVDLDADALSTLPGGIAGYHADVTSEDDVKVVVEEINERVGPIEILINNAGVIYSEPMVNIMNPASMTHNYQNFRKTIIANLDSAFVMTAAVVHQMVTHRLKGVVINISSISARGNEGQTAYSAAKAGVNAMTITWSKELGRFGIRCNAVAPGFIGTESTHKALSESIIKHIKDNTPLRRLGDASEVAQAVAAAITNDFMNGVILDVNGGITI